METENKHIDINLITRYLSSETSVEENKIVEQWFAASDENRREFESFKKTWDSIGNTSRGSEIDIDKEWNYLQKTIHVKKSTSGIFRLPAAIRIAASIVFFVGVGLAIARYFSIESVKTRPEETRQIILADGSIVTLNAGSKLFYSHNFNAKNRTVRLIGEGYFEVEKNPDVPFIIRLGVAEVKVLGTSFNIKAYKNSDNIEVTVHEGTVSLYEKTEELKHVVATTGEKALYNRHMKVVSKKVNTNQNFLAWKTRIIKFNNDNLSDVANILGEVYHKEFVLSDTTLYACTLTTQFEDEDIETVLRVLESTLDIIVTTDKDKYIISGNGCK